MSLAYSFEKNLAHRYDNLKLTKKAILYLCAQDSWEYDYSYMNYHQWHNGLGQQVPKQGKFWTTITPSISWLCCWHMWLPIYLVKWLGATSKWWFWKCHHHATLHLRPWGPVALIIDTCVYGAWRLARGNKPVRSQCRIPLMRVVLYSMSQGQHTPLQCLSADFFCRTCLHTDLNDGSRSWKEHRSQSPQHWCYCSLAQASLRTLPCTWSPATIAWWPMSVIGMDGPLQWCDQCQGGAEHNTASWWPWMWQRLGP